ncbi:MAG: hypothetical protein R6W80_05135 [Haliea sp.]
MEAILDATQWPAMATTLIAAWLVGSRSARKRRWGFGWFILSNVLWIIWGGYAAAYALIALQVGLFAINIRGSRHNDASSYDTETVKTGP